MDSRAVDKKRSIYEYDEGNEIPLKGELALMLENTELNFFCGNFFII